MPKVSYTSSKGLFQEAGTSDVNLSGEGALFGNLLKIKRNHWRFELAKIIEQIGTIN